MGGEKRPFKTVYDNNTTNTRKAGHLFLPPEVNLQTISITDFKNFNQSLNNTVHTIYFHHDSMMQSIPISSQSTVESHKVNSKTTFESFHS